MSRSPHRINVRDHELEDWARVLDHLEACLSVAGSQAGDEDVERIATWEPHPGLGPLPAELAGRAEKVLIEQSQAMGRLRAEMAANRCHDQMLSGVPAVRDASAAAFLDTQA